MAEGAKRFGSGLAATAESPIFPGVFPGILVEFTFRRLTNSITTSNEKNEKLVNRRIFDVHDVIRYRFFAFINVSFDA